MDIVDVIGDYVNLKRAGANYKGLSPFNEEKTPSFMVSPAKEIFKCFSSSKGGDAITFIMEIEGVGYIEAIKQLAKKYGVEVQEEEATDEQKEAQSEREALFIVLNFAKDFFADTLWKHEEGQSIGYSYFKERGFSDDTIRTFDLGYALEAWKGLTDVAVKKGHSPDLLEKAGLLIRKEDKSYDRFRGRVVFPIHNVAGKPIAFGARILKKGDAAKNQPKYINSPETPVYHKSDVLYGIHQARHAIRKEDTVYLVEGYTDVVSLYQAGVQNVVASSGTALTTNQIRLIRRFTENVTVLFDGDAAGIRASLRGIDMILEGGLNVKAVVFPDKEDPDSYSRKLGGPAFKQYLLDNAKDFITFKAGLLTDSTEGDPVARAQTIRDIVESISRIPDAIKRSVYLRQTSQLLGVEEQVLINEQNKLLIQRERDQQKEQRRKAEEPGTVTAEEVLAAAPEEAPRPADSQEGAMREKGILRYLLLYGQEQVNDQQRLYEYILDEISDYEFETAIYKDILSQVLNRVKAGATPEAKWFMHNAEPAIQQEVTDMITERYQISENWQKQYQIHVPNEQEVLGHSIYSDIQYLKLYTIRKTLSDIIDQLKHADNDDEMMNLQRLHMSYKAKMMEITGPKGSVIGP